MIKTRKRLDPAVFDLPVEKMRAGWYTDAYFNHARATLRADGRRPRVVMQVFQKNHAYLGGMDEAIAILKLCADDWNELEVHALYDGDTLAPHETVLTIEGDYTTFASRDADARHARAAHTDHHECCARAGGDERQAADLHARVTITIASRRATLRGVRRGQIVGAPIGVTTDEQASWWGGTGIGTVPHARSLRMAATPRARRRTSPTGRRRT
jgi:nicotinate phosphoribosyltransferase